MKLLLYIILMANSIILVDFSEPNSLSNWRIVDDVVMGGRSDGKFYTTQDGTAVFEGKVSLENNGGFSSIRHRFPKLDLQNRNKVKIRLKGDGKVYQFRIKSQTSVYYSYVNNFKTTGEWQDVEIILADMYPVFRGRKLNLPNFENSSIEEVAILIGNKKAENFRLEIASIEII